MGYLFPTLGWPSLFPLFDFDAHKCDVRMIVEPSTLVEYLMATFKSKGPNLVAKNVGKVALRSKQYGIHTFPIQTLATTDTPNDKNWL